MGKQASTQPEPMDIISWARQGRRGSEKSPALHGQFICATPVIWFAGDTARLGLNGAVAIT